MSEDLLIVPPHVRNMVLVGKNHPTCYTLMSPICMTHSVTQANRTGNIKYCYLTHPEVSIQYT